MSGKRILFEMGRIILAGAIALVILTLFCMLYYNVPIRYACEDGATDCRRESNIFYSRGTEGFAYGRTNNEGYANMFDYNEETQIDILVMGSSNMEACQVAMEESTSSRLNVLLEDDIVYNIGMDSHDFLVCASNLKAAVSKYQPSKYVIIETAAIQFSNEDTINAIKNIVPEISSYSGGLIGFLQNNQYLRLINAQRGKFMEGKKDILDFGIFTQADNTKGEKFIKVNEVKKAGTVMFTEQDENTNIDSLNILLQKMNDIVQVSGAKIIIVYHPQTALMKDGSLSLINNPDAIEQFTKICENNGIIFLDMSDRFLKEYTDNFILPYGFSNTSVGIGHMNKYGHAMMADELYKLIERKS